MRLSTVLSLVVTASACVVQAVDIPSPAHKSQSAEAAVAVLKPTGEYKAHGKVHFQKQEGSVHLSGQIEGLTPGLHGFHIHEFGDLSAADGSSAGGHYNPGGHKHGGPDKPNRHAGDLGNVKADEKGVARIDIKVEGIDIADIIGRSLVVHADADDLKSQPAGNAGPRAALGVIGIAARPKGNEGSTTPSAPRPAATGR
jgi:superoxide dismutase, Cu-Zn family